MHKNVLVKLPPRVFNVIFENKLGIFRNGQKLTGAILIETEETLDFEGNRGGVLMLLLPMVLFLLLLLCCNHDCY